MWLIHSIISYISVCFNIKYCFLLISLRKSVVLDMCHFDPMALVGTPRGSLLSQFESRGYIGLPVIYTLLWKSFELFSYISFEGFEGAIKR